MRNLEIPGIFDFSDNGLGNIATYSRDFGIWSPESSNRNLPVFSMDDAVAVANTHFPNFSAIQADSFVNDVTESLEVTTCCACSLCDSQLQDAKIEFATRDFSPFDWVSEDFDTSISGGDFAGLISYFQKGDGRLFMDTPGDITTTATVAVNGSTSDTLEVSLDQDWFSVTLTAGQRYLIGLNGDSSNSNALSDPLVRLLDSSGVQITQNDDGGIGLNSLISYTADVSGTYYISAQSWVDPDTNTSSTGDYTVSVTEAPPLAERTVDGIANFLTDEFSARAAYNQTTVYYDVSGLTAGQQTLALAAMQAWADVSPLLFAQAGGGNPVDITFQNTGSGAFNSNSTSGGVILSGTVNVNSTWNMSNLALDSYTYQTYIHEVGHALGLGHAGPYNGNAQYGIDNVYLNDSWAYTVMSYFDQNESSYFGDYRYVLGPQIADILAMQDLYGTNTTTRTGNTVYGFNSTETDVHNFSQFTMPPSLSIWDAGGIDTLDMSGYSNDQEIDLREEEFSDINGVDSVISIARGVVIENAIGGSGVDTITGNAANNVLTGGAGNDILDGGAGTDYAVYSGTGLSDYTIVLNGDGSYTVTHNSGGADGVDTLSNIEFVRINGVDHALGGGGTFTENADTHTGTAGDDIFDALGGDDVVSGAGGNDTINGGSGNDTLNGDDGNDILIGGAGADALSGGAGTDTASYAGSSAAVSVNLNNGAVSGGDAAGDTLISIENLTGSDHNDTLFGNTSNNVINGGLGNDTIAGDAGNDTINGNEGDDVIYAGQGVDTVDGGVGNDIIIGGDVTDYLIGGEDNDNINGKGGNDVINGGSGNDILNGEDGNDSISAGDGNDSLAGGNGNDYLNAGAGDDSIYGGDGNDTVIAGAGVDTIIAGIGDDNIFGQDGNDTIYSGSGVDTVSGGNGNDVIIGGEQVDTLKGENDDDTIYGQGGNDVLEGGAGNDVVNGGAGDDTINGNSGSDVLTGAAGIDTIYGDGGTDLIYAGDGADFLYGGNGNDTLFAGAGNDYLEGGAGDDKLYGQANTNTLYGGAGDDNYYGGTSDDTFVFNAADGAATERVSFFNLVDTVELNGFGFANVAAASSSFVQSGSNVIFNSGGVQIIFYGANVGQVRSRVQVDGLMELPDDKSGDTITDVIDVIELDQDLIAEFLGRSDAEAAPFTYMKGGIMTISDDGQIYDDGFDTLPPYDFG